MGLSSLYERVDVRVEKLEVYTAVPYGFRVARGKAVREGEVDEEGGFYA